MRILGFIICTALLILFFLWRADWDVKCAFDKNPQMCATMKRGANGNGLR